MRVAVIGADGVVGRGVAARLVAMGHSVVGVAPVRPIGWPGTVDFVRADPSDGTAVRGVITDADAIAHCAPGAHLLEVTTTARGAPMRSASRGSSQARQPISSNPARKDTTATPTMAFTAMCAMRPAMVRSPHPRDGGVW